MDLLERLRKSRETGVTVGKYKLTITRPTDVDAASMKYDNEREALEGVSRFVIGWEGVTELDIVPGGTADPVQFEKTLFYEWLKDQPDLWGPLIEAVMTAYTNHRERQDKQGNA